MLWRMSTNRNRRRNAQRNSCEDADHLHINEDFWVSFRRDQRTAHKQTHETQKTDVRHLKWHSLRSSSQVVDLPGNTWTEINIHYYAAHQKKHCKINNLKQKDKKSRSFVLAIGGQVGIEAVGFFRAICDTQHHTLNQTTITLPLALRTDKSPLKDERGTQDSTTQGTWVT